MSHGLPKVERVGLLESADMAWIKCDLVYTGLRHEMAKAEEA